MWWPLYGQLTDSKRALLIYIYQGGFTDDFLEHCESIATKRAFVQQFEKEMKNLAITKTELAERMQTSRSSVNRLLDPSQPSNLNTLIGAARAIGKHLQLFIV